MNRLHIIGRKNHGKTTLVVDLVQAMSRRGMRVGTIKHTHHQHELDTPGKDSHRHRVAGAARVGILSPQMNACFWPTDAASSDTPGSDRYAPFAAMFSDCDLVLVEGDTEANAAKLEVWRRSVGSLPIATSDPTIRAVVTDDACEVGCEILPRSDVDGLADFIVRRVLTG